MSDLTDEYIAMIRNNQQEINHLKEKVRRLSMEVYELKSEKDKKKMTSVLHYGSEYDDWRTIFN